MPARLLGGVGIHALHTNVFSVTKIDVQFVDNCEFFRIQNAIITGLKREEKGKQKME